MKTIIYGLSILLGISACQKEDNPAPLKERKDIVLTRSEQTMMERNNEFAFNLFRQICTDKKKENLFVSPLSASLSLSMTGNGAATATAEEMKSVLGFADNSWDELNTYYQKLSDGLQTVDPATTLKIANSIWIKQDFPVQKTFTDLNRDKYNADVRNLDFASPQAPGTINKWCADHTNNRIEKVLDVIDPNARMFLINALYFKGTWKSKFDKAATTKAPFNNMEASAPVDVNMMHQQCNAPYTTDNGLQIAELPYGNEAFSMVILLPEEGQSIQEINNRLTPENWTRWMESLHVQRLDLRLPKFKVEYKRQLKEDLIAMGMQLPFTPAADFSNMSTAGQLHIAFVQQNTFVETNEEGTEAAAVTTTGMGLTSAGPGSQPPAFTVNRPFIYVIKEKSTGAILFMGRTLYM